jgi:hypothetical protein
MRAADDSISSWRRFWHRGQARTGEDVITDDGIFPNIAFLDKPSVQRTQVGVFRVPNGDRDFAGAVSSGP